MGECAEDRDELVCCGEIQVVELLDGGFVMPTNSI